MCSKVESESNRIFCIKCVSFSLKYLKYSPKKFHINENKQKDPDAFDIREIEREQDSPLYILRFLFVILSSILRHYLSLVIINDNLLKCITAFYCNKNYA